MDRPDDLDAIVFYAASISVAIWIGPTAAFWVWPLSFLLHPLAQVIAQRRAVGSAGGTAG